MKTSEKITQAKAHLASAQGCINRAEEVDKGFNHAGARELLVDANRYMKAAMLFMTKT